MQTIYEQSYAWAGMNFLLYIVGVAVLIGMAIVVGFSIQDWLDAASKRRAEFINSIRNDQPSAKKR